MTTPQPSDTPCADQWAAEARFMAKAVSDAGGCWLWTGYVQPNGYGQFSNEDRVLVMAHRWSYEHFVGAVPPGLQLDHLCMVRHCVNPEHLEAVTPRENTVRSFKARGSDVACRNGHSRTPENTYVYPNGDRSCRDCKRQRDRNYEARRRAS